MFNLEFIKELSELLQKYGIGDDHMAFQLESLGVTEITDNMSETLSYLRKYVDLKSIHTYQLADLFKRTIPELEASVELYYYYTDKPCEKPYDPSSLFVTQDYIDSEKKFWEDKGFSEEQTHKIIGSLLTMVSKSRDEIEDTLEYLKVFDLPQEELRRFVTENTFFLLRDYSRKLDVLFNELIEEYGDKKTAYKALCEHPEFLMKYNL